MSLQPNGRRAAIIDGLRTPFAKQGTEFSNMSALDLGRLVSAELISRLDIDPAVIEQVVYGQVIPSVKIHNIAREIVLSTDLPPQTDAYSLSRACATSYQTTINLMRAIEDGAIDCGLAGGAESTSVVPVTVTRKLQQALLQASRADSIAERGRAFLDLRPGDLVPQQPTLEEPSTGETMGEGAEHMAKVNQIPREAQDEFAHRSHVLAARAWDEGKFDAEVMALHVPPDYEVTVTQDTIVRHDSQLDAYADLPPVFDERYGEKNGRGFYRYDGSGGEDVDRSVYQVLGVKPVRSLEASRIQERCVLSMVNEAATCYGEGILRSARDGNIGAVFGLGYPPFLGGPFRTIDNRGAGEIVEKLERYQSQHGARFAPAPLLKTMAEGRLSFAAGTAPEPGGSVREGVSS